MTPGEEELARAAYEARFDQRGPRGVVPNWNDLGDGARLIWLRVAVAVLATAIGGTESNVVPIRS